MKKGTPIVGTIDARMRRDNVDQEENSDPDAVVWSRHGSRWIDAYIVHRETSKSAATCSRLTLEYYVEGVGVCRKTIRENSYNIRFLSEKPEVKSRSKLMKQDDDDNCIELAHEEQEVAATIGANAAFRSVTFDVASAVGTLKANRVRNMQPHGTRWGSFGCAYDDEVDSWASALEATMQAGKETATEIRSKITKEEFDGGGSDCSGSSYEEQDPEIFAFLARHHRD